MGLVTSKTAEATYQHKGDYALSSDLQGYQPVGNYITQEQLNSFSPINLNVANGFNAPKANATLYGVTLDSGGISSLNKGGYISVNNDLVVKGDNVVTFKKMSGGTYISDSPDYNIEEAVRGGKSKGNAIISSTKDGLFGMLTTDGTGNASNLSLRNNGEVFIVGNNFCFADKSYGKVCFSASDLDNLKKVIPQPQQPQNKGVPPAKYLRTRNYMHY